MVEPRRASANRDSSPWWAPIALSWSFLTILPIPWVEANSRAIGTAIALFPVVGIALGGALGEIGIALDRFLPPGPTAVILLGLGTVATGGLHLDGLMDTADGVFGGRTPTERLAIMRDSRVGAFGASAGALVLLGEYACLGELRGAGRLTALVAALAMGRWAMAIAVAHFPAARPSGLGATFHGAASRWSTMASTLVAAALAVTLGQVGLAGFVAATLVAILAGRFLVSRLGGLTGDTYGTIAVLAEVLVLYLAVAMRGQ